MSGNSGPSRGPRPTVGERTGRTRWSLRSISSSARGVCRCEKPSGRSQRIGSPPICATLDRVANPTLRAQAHGENALSPARLVLRGRHCSGKAAGLTPACQGPSSGSGGAARRGLATPARTVSPEGGDLGFGRLAADGGGAGDRRLVWLPRLASDVGVGTDPPLPPGHQRAGAKPCFGGGLARAGG